MLCSLQTELNKVSGFVVVCLFFERENSLEKPMIKWSLFLQLSLGDPTQYLIPHLQSRGDCSALVQTPKQGQDSTENLRDVSWPDTGRFLRISHDQWC